MSSIEDYEYYQTLTSLELSRKIKSLRPHLKKKYHAGNERQESLALKICMMQSVLDQRGYLKGRQA